MRNKFSLIIALLYISVLIALFYLCLEYVAIRFIVFPAIGIRLVVYIYVSYLRVKRNGLNLYTEQGKKEIKSLNRKINFWNGRD